jgi:integrase
VVFEVDQSQKQVDPDDILTHEEIEAIRREVDASVNPIRDRALLEMLIYTGQRIRALQTLRIKDVNADESPGYVLLNDEIEGLKRATQRGRRRPLLASRKYVRDWLERHPQRDDPDAWLFIGQPSHSTSDPDKPWSAEQMRRMLRRAAKRAGIENYKDRVHPHAFRHYWYTNMRLRENADPEDLKAVGGWSEGSNTPEEIYKNFHDDEHGKRLERDLGHREKDDIRQFIPETCPVCAEPLEKHWSQCPNCGEDFEEDIVQEVEEDTIDAKYNAEDDEKKTTWEDIQQLLMENPERAKELLDGN